MLFNQAYNIWLCVNCFSLTHIDIPGTDAKLFILCLSARHSALKWWKLWIINSAILIIIYKHGSARSSWESFGRSSSKIKGRLFIAFILVWWSKISYLHFIKQTCDLTVIRRTWYLLLTDARNGCYCSIQMQNIIFFKSTLLNRERTIVESAEWLCSCI